MPGVSGMEALARPEGETLSEHVVRLRSAETGSKKGKETRVVR